MNNETIHLIIRSKENVLYDADVRSVSGINANGPFDVLPEHANFICIVEKYIVIHEINGKTHQLKIEAGILHVHEGAVSVFLTNR